MVFVWMMICDEWMWFVWMMIYESMWFVWVMHVIVYKSLYSVSSYHPLIITLVIMYDIHDVSHNEYVMRGGVGTLLS